MKTMNMMMKTIIWNQLSTEEQMKSFVRPAITASSAIGSSVNTIRDRIIKEGDQALLALTEQFDGVKLDSLMLTPSKIDEAKTKVSPEFKAALQKAYDNIYTFHKAQIPNAIDIETQKGVRCEVLIRAIQKVGLYIPGGTAPLFSTVLMLAIPAKIAGCKEICLASPPPIADEIVYAAQLCGIDTIYTMGGAQAIFALGLGTRSVKKVDKIFGPGNSYVTEAKKQVSQMLNGAAIDMPAGPSEVLVIADEMANPEYVASDLLSQAEHGEDSQVVLVTTSLTLADNVNVAINEQLKVLNRAETARKSLANSLTIIADNLDEAVMISNEYAPEHLILQTENPRQLLPTILHAGSVFLGAYSPESVGDYASGTNHVLPTYGFAKNYSSLGLADFYKRMTVQELTQEGFMDLAPAVSLLAGKELLGAHKLAVDIRLKTLKGEARE